MKFKLIFAWYDLWVGLFYDQKKSWLYIFPIPMFGLILKLPQKRYWIYSTRIDHVVGSTNKTEIDHFKKDKAMKFLPYWAANGEFEPLFGKDLNDD